METKKKQLVAVIPHTCEGVDVSDTTAGQADVRSGKYFYSALGDRVEGQIADYSGATAVTPTEQAQTVGTAGKYVENDITVGAIPSNYKDTTGTDATAGDMLAGAKAVTSAGLVTGNIPTYAGASTVTQNGTLPTAGKYVESDIEVSVPSQTPTLITKQITANGTYNAASDNADGYSQVTVSVAAVSKLPHVADGSVTSIDAADLAGATIIKRYMFDRCYSLQSIEIPNGVTEIGAFAFNDLRSLIGDVVIPNSVTKINEYAFYRQFKTTTNVRFIIGSGITRIADQSFNFNGVASYTILSTTPPTLTSSNAFITNVPKYIPNGTLTDYQTATNWSAYANDFVELPANS